jgi:hypothetical protein
MKKLNNVVMNFILRHKVTFAIPIILHSINIAYSFLQLYLHAKAQTASRANQIAHVSQMVTKEDTSVYVMMNFLTKAINA